MRSQDSHAPVRPAPAKLRWALLLAGVFLAVTLIWRMLLWTISYRIFTRIREAVVRDLRSAFFRHINSLCLRFHVRHQSGELFSYLFGTPLTQVQTYFQQLTQSGPVSLFSALSIIVVVMFWDPFLTAVLILSVMACGLVMIYSGRRVMVLSANYQERERHVSGRVADLIRGTRHVKLYAIEDDVAGQFWTQAESLGQHVVQRDVRTHELLVRYEAVIYVGYAFLIAVGLGDLLPGTFKSENLQPTSAHSPRCKGR